MIDNRPTHDQVKKDIRGKKCIRHPDQMLTVGMDFETGDYFPNCPECVREGHKELKIVGRNDTAERSWNMVEKRLATRDQQITDLTVDEVKDLLPVANCTEGEIKGFIRVCQGTGLNPWLREIYLIKYETGKAASVHIGYQHYVERGILSNRYMGHKSGITVQNMSEDDTGKIIKRTGEGMRPGDALWGAWIEIHRAGMILYENEITLKENDKHQAVWKTSPALMIHKTMKGRGFKEALPGEFVDITEVAHLVEAEGLTMGAEEADLPPMVIEAQVTEVQYPPVEGAVTEIGADELDCPRHQGKVWEKKSWGYAHYLEEGERGPRGGKWCNRDQVLTAQAKQTPLVTREDVPETAQGDAPVNAGTPSEPVSDPQATETHETPDGDLRAFGNVTEFWEAVNEKGWGRELVGATLGCTMAEWLAAGTPQRTWSDAWQFLSANVAKE